KMPCGIGYFRKGARDLLEVARVEGRASAYLVQLTADAVVLVFQPERSRGIGAAAELGDIRGRHRSGCWGDLLVMEGLGNIRSLDRWDVCPTLYPFLNRLSRRLRRSQHKLHGPEGREIGTGEVVSLRQLRGLSDIAQQEVRLPHFVGGHV